MATEILGTGRIDAEFSTAGYIILEQVDASNPNTNLVLYGTNHRISLRELTYQEIVPTQTISIYSIGGELVPVDPSETMVLPDEGEVVVVVQGSPDLLENQTVQIVLAGKGSSKETVWLDGSQSAAATMTVPPGLNRVYAYITDILVP